ncbi:hypothetical protein SBI_05566 [Streptomyces bingchenggensis BCW-1]|uniref:Uncharacterized protein n=1 Tax=Streptomyces bingchenggensis (strain BCW-1) TaxID=749414 RepID=D7CAW9_STRBB|nr:MULTISPECIES: hypothetical protein [Streptomyces]ADI08686.1 hypothetical protein SBI_05566 [Streptomyces bingchenggensis BCW-1]
MNLSRRSYALIAALVLSLLTLVYLGSRGSRDAAGESVPWPADDPCLKDAPHPSDWDEEEPRLVTLSHGYSSKSPLGGEKHFTIGASINVGRHPLVLHTPLAQRGVSVRFCAPHGKGLMAEAKGLSPKSVEAPAAKDGAIRVTREKPLHFTVELPPSALRNGYSMSDLMASTPPRSNDAADYPVLVLTVSDPGLDAPLVAVSFKPDSTPTAQALGAPARVS